MIHSAPTFALFFVLARALSTFSVAYGLGSIPCGLIIARMGGLGDIRRIGSGNIGATNVLRSGRKMLALATLLCDAAKGIAAVVLVRALYGSDYIYVAALFAVIGHIFPVWLKFKGGKGVATTLGALFAIHWLVGLTTCAVWLGVFIYERVSSIAALASLWSAPILAYALEGEAAALLCLSLATLATFTHRANIGRIMNGTEPSFRKN